MAGPCSGLATDDVGPSTTGAVGAVGRAGANSPSAVHTNGTGGTATP
jgi:hypothetical protein